ncbi:transposase [Azospirillum argentinense]
MWTPENRERHDRSGLRYPSDLSDEEWRLVEPLIPPARRGGRHRSVDLRAVLNGVLYVLETGCQWRHLPGLAAAQHGARLSAPVGLGGDVEAHPP